MDWKNGKTSQSGKILEKSENLASFYFYLFSQIVLIKLFVKYILYLLNSLNKTLKK